MQQETQRSKITVPRLKKQKGSSPIVCVTAYDAPFAHFADQAGVDVILVGDSLGNVVLGYENTIPVTLQEMVDHTAAVRRGTDYALVVADLPFGSYGASVEQGVMSAVALMKAGAECVKLEGDFPDTVEAIVRLGIPVMGHLGLTPQSINQFGGFKVQGKQDAAQAILKSQAGRLHSAGAFSVVLELIPALLARAITAESPLLTIGIGAGEGCDGQIQVLHDVLGLSPTKLKHSHRFGELGEAAVSALSNYSKAVRAREFPTEENSF